MARDDIWNRPADDCAALARLERLVIALENARPILLRVMRGGPGYPGWHNLVVELGNLDFELRQLAPERDPETGEILHPEEIKLRERFKKGGK